MFLCFNLKMHPYLCSLVNETKNPQHLDCGRSIPATRGTHATHSSQVSIYHIKVWWILIIWNSSDPDYPRLYASPSLNESIITSAWISQEGYHFSVYHPVLCASLVDTTIRQLNTMGLNEQIHMGVKLWITIGKSGRIFLHFANLTEVCSYRFNYLSNKHRLHRWSLGMDKQFHPTLYNGCDYISMLGLKLMHVSKRDCWWFVSADMYLLTSSS